MKTLSDYYKKQIRTVHSTKTWGASSGKWVGTVQGFMEKFKLKSILDYGSGLGVLSKRLRKYQYTVTEYDPGIPEKATKPVGKFDMIVSTDVFEHIEEDYIDNVLAEIKGYMNNCGFFTICLGIARNHILPDGRNAHILLKSREWWAKKLSKYFNFKEVHGRGWREREMVVFVTLKNDE